MTANYKSTTIQSMKEIQTEHKEKFLQVRMDSVIMDKAKVKAKQSGLTLSQVVRKLLEDFVEDPQQKLIFG